jgi:hypothetical protein
MPVRKRRLADALRGFGPIGILAIALIVLAGNTPLPGTAGLMAIAWVRLTGTPWARIGYVRPRSWILAVAGGVLAGVTFKLVMKALVMPLLGADPVNHAYHFLAGNPDALPGVIVMILAGAGFGEETVFRGFLFERLGRLLGTGALASAATVVISAAVFGALHIRPQGWAGVQQAAIVGLVFGTVRVRTGRIVPLMFAHAAFDLTAVAIIYWNLENRVAHLIFR